MVEQPDGVSRILCCDQIHFLECPQYTVCNILKIADRGGTQIECAGFMLFHDCSFLVLQCSAIILEYD